MKTENFVYTVKFTVDESTRKIEGLATGEGLDKDNEIILAKALKKAIPFYMKLPVLTVDHTERPVGLCDELTLKDDNQVYLKGWIKDTEDADDVWDRILKGVKEPDAPDALNAFSIYGRRIKGTSPCKLHPSVRTEPCVSEEVYIDSITLCGNNKRYPGATLNIVKAVFGDSIKIEEGLKSNQVTLTDKDVILMPEEEITKSETLANKVDRLLKHFGIKDTEIVKAEECPKEEKTEPIEKSEEEPEKEEEKKEEVVEKAAIEPETITKAEMFSVITKALTDALNPLSEKLTSLEAKIEKMENETIQKGATAVIIAGELDDVGIGNAAAINNMQKRKRGDL